MMLQPAQFPIQRTCNRRVAPSTWSTGKNRWARTPSTHSVDITTSDTQSGTYSPGHTYAYVQLSDLIESFQDQNSDLRVDQEAAEDARGFLRHLVSINARPPKAFPSGGEAVVFVWDKPHGRDYAFYSDDVISLTYMPTHGEELRLDLDLRNDPALTTFASYLRR